MEERKENTGKLSNGTILGYGFGAMADAAAYNFYVMYALYFLTTIAGMGAGRAGIIISAATVISSVFGLVIGPLSDNTKSRLGRRRPYILAGGILMLIGLTLFFRPVDLSGGAQFAYYLCMFIIVNLAYGAFLVPYNALGAELTDDYDERTKLRTPATFMNCVGNIIGISLPLTVVGIFVGRGSSEGSAWNYFAIIVGAACFLALFITFMTTKGKEMPPEKLEEERKEINPLRTFWQILKMKPFKYIIAILVLFAIGYMVFQSGLVYYVLYCAGLTEAQYSTAMFIYVFIGMGWTVVISFIATKMNKKNGMAFCFLISAAGMTVLYFTGVHSFAMLIVLLLIFGLGNGAYWLIIYPIVYDLAELYEYKYGKRKEGALMSLYGVIFTLSTALGTQVLMLTMTAAGYDPSLTVQSEGTVSGISAIVIGIPVIVFILAAICCIIYPMSKKTFEKLMSELEKKRAGEKNDEEGLERIV